MLDINKLDENKKILILIPNLILLVWAFWVFIRQINSDVLVIWKIVSAGIGLVIFLTLIGFFIIRLNHKSP